MREQWLPQAELRRRQLTRFRALVRHALERSPFYRARLESVGVTPDSIRDLADLARLPITTREDLRRPELLLAGHPKRRGWQTSQSSGSTGRRTISWFDPDAWLMGKHLLKLRARLACGVRLTDRIALFQESSEPEKRGTLGRMRTFSVHRPIEEVLPAVRAFAPTVVYGFPGHLLRLGRGASGALSPRLVFTSGELLDPATRRQLEEAFVAPVLDVYGCTEVKEIAWQCPTRDGYHVNADWLIVECLEAGNRHGRPPGTVLVTCLYNFAMPLLRYEVGDTGEVLPVPCRCGRGLPLIRPTWGRSVDYLRLPAGGSITPYSLTLAIEHIEGIRQFQIIQEDLRTVEMRVVPDDSFGEAEAEAARTALGAVLPGVRVMVRRSADLPHEASGKFRKVVSKVPTEQALAEPG